MLQPNVADGVHRIEDSYTNWYLVEKNGRLTVIDAGVRTSWRSLLEALGALRAHLPDRDAVLVGDAIVTLDPYTARRGPRLVARAATADSERALRSLVPLVETGARKVLVGHGESWTDGVEAAAAHARQAGAA